MNFIDIVSRDNDTFIAKLNDKLTVNALTGALVRESIFFVQQRRRGALGTNLDEMDPADVPTIDQFSEDERQNEAGRDLTEQQQFEQGHEVRDPYKTMCILNGLRYRVYNDLYRFVDVPHPDVALFTEPKRVAGSPINYDVPMSAERFVDFRIQVSANVNEKDLKDAMAEDPKADEAHLRSIFAEQARRRQAQLRELKTEILTEINGLPSESYDSSGFEALPILTQIAIATKVVTKLQAEHDRLQTIRTTEMASNRAAIRNEITVLQAALNEIVRKARHLAE